MRAMRIGIDCRKIFDFGIGTYIRGLLSGLAQLAGGDEVIAFVPSRARALLPAGVEAAILDTPNYSIREMFTLRAAIERAGVQLFHSPHYVLPFTRCPSVVTLHDVILLRFRPRNPLGGMYVETMTRRAVVKSARVLTVTNAAKADLVNVLDCDPEKISVTPNGVDPIPEVPPAAGRYFLFVGNDKPHKNVDRLIEAFAEVRATDRGVDLVLVGGAFDRHAHRDGVQAEGFVADDRLASLYRGAIALVIPSLDEGFGLPALEAMSCGTAVIASAIPALLEVTADAAVHVDPDSVRSIADGMARVANDGDLRQSLARRGIERARQFTWTRCAEETLRAYRQVTA